MEFKLRIILVNLFIIFYSSLAFSQIQLPKLISNGLILQRDVETKVWGWAAKNEKIRLKFNDSTYYTSADNSGNWNISLPAMKAGGPYEMRFFASNNIVIKDILFGDVWVCSGQSNMELPMRRVSWVYKDVIAKSTNKFIRQFMVPRNYNFKKTEKDLDGGKWVEANPVDVMGFSAVAYFFSNELYKKYKVPIGLINTSLGGSPIEAWISEKSLKQFPAHYNEAQRFKNDSLITKIKQEDAKRIQSWYGLLNKSDLAYKDAKGAWYEQSFDASGWSEMPVPGFWTNTPLEKINGVIWFRKKIDLPNGIHGKPAKLILGTIVDADSVFFNGKFVGTTSYRYPPRRYDIPPELLKKGQNTVAIRAISNNGTGGFVPDKDYVIIVDKDTFDLSGNWNYKIGAKMQPLAGQTFIRWKPAGLYNAMIAPLLNYKIKGVIWFQGESNVGRAKEYTKLFPTLIEDWRKDWKQGDFPFLYAQLANYLEPKDNPSESSWAQIRESQLKTLSVPKTGMAVAVDIGEWNDIHPLNKKEVGYRLAINAMKLAYNNEKVVSSGPTYKSMKIDGNKIILTFENLGKGLISKNNRPLKYFAIAGEKQQFVWAKAIIKNNQVIVWNDSIKHPLAVRYAWADNPEGANLYNKSGLPASPFRTDDW